MASPRRASKPTPPSGPTRRERRLVSQQKAADYLDVSLRTVRYMIADGRLRAYRLGRTVRLDLNEIDDALEAFGGAVNGGGSRDGGEG